LRPEGSNGLVATALRLETFVDPHPGSRFAPTLGIRTESRWDSPNTWRQRGATKSTGRMASQLDAASPSRRRQGADGGAGPLIFGTAKEEWLEMR